MYGNKSRLLLISLSFIIVSCLPVPEVHTQTATSTSDSPETKTPEVKPWLTFDAQATSDAQQTADAILTIDTRETLAAGKIITADYKETKTALFEENLTKTAETKYSTATAIQQSTAEAVDNLLNSVSNWDMELSDSFSKPSSIWTVYYNKEDDYSELKASVKDEKFRIEDYAKKSHGFWECFSRSQSDFYVTFEGEIVEGTEYEEYGIAFRVVDNQRFYIFLISGDQRYTLVQQNGSFSDTLIGWTYSPFLRLDQENRISVVAQGDHFSFFINDNFIAEYEDDEFDIGILCLLVYVMEGNKGIFEFDNVELRAP